MFDFVVPGLLLIASLLALRKQENVYGLLVEGGAEGLRLLGSILPTLIILLTAVHMLRASGAVERIAKLLSPTLSLLGIP